jgi:hypothetical protein
LGFETVSAHQQPDPTLLSRYRRCPGLPTLRKLQPVGVREAAIAPATELLRKIRMRKEKAIQNQQMYA